MGAVLLSPLYILANIYLAARLLRWFSTLNSFLGSLWFIVPFFVCYAFLALTPLLAAFTRGRVKAWTKRISNYWLGILMYLLIFLILMDLSRMVIRLLQHRSVLAEYGTFYYRIAAGIAICAAAILSLYGIRHAAKIKKTHYDVTVQKDCSLPALKIALVADLHLGYNVSLRHIQRVRNTIQSIHPDLIVYAGDIFDNEFEAVPHPKKAAAILGSLKSTYGSFACWGNHDIEELILAGFTFHSGNSKVSSDPRMNAFLKKAGIRLLEDETVLIADSFYLCGRLDASCKEKSGTIRLTPSEITAGLDPARPVFIIDHQPSQLKELSAAGADLVLSGHTHDGQMFPGNVTTRIGWMNSCGKLVLGSMTSIVTSGAGIWGPAMRIGTDSEVVEIQVNFKKTV
ncbi:MAG: metallophosphoesterase [Lachnospiraceae bacterium]|nr:metallophosphoesterase [Lachnospiraceae bacterium]